jgi:hypothetical protein
MRARIDFDGQEFPAQIVRRVYDGDFLARIGRQFKFDGQSPDINAKIFRMGISYITSRRMEDREDFAKLNKQYVKLAREIDKFRVALKSNADLDLPQVMYFAALELSESAPSGDFPGLTDHERSQSGEPHFRELMRLLNILANGVREDMRQSAPKRGRRANWGLDGLALNSAQFFAVELNKRPFTIDPHKPFKPTEAFDFIKALVDPLDNVSDDAIVTAIRAAKTLPKSRKG